MSSMFWQSSPTEAADSFHKRRPATRQTAMSDKQVPKFFWRTPRSCQRGYTVALIFIFLYLEFYKFRNWSIDLSCVINSTSRAHWYNPKLTFSVLKFIMKTLRWLCSDVILQEGKQFYPKQLTRVSDNNKEQRGAEIGEGNKPSADKSYN